MGIRGHRLVVAACFAMLALATAVLWTGVRQDTARANERTISSTVPAGQAQPDCVLAHASLANALPPKLSGAHFNAATQQTPSRADDISPPSEPYDALSSAAGEEACAVGASSASIALSSTSPPRGLAGDLWADVILGKPDFSEIGPGEVVPFKVFNPGGVVIDRSVAPGIAYVWDAGNSRILGINLANCYAGESPCGADLVIGQPTAYDRGACNGDSGVQSFPERAQASAETLCGIPDVSASPAEHKSIVSMAVDQRGALYVPDSFNNRVLRYDDPFGSDARADQVWGQSDFSGMMCNQGTFDSATAETLCFHSRSNRFEPGHYGAGVALDSSGNLWVADSGNNRVLRFPIRNNSGEISKRADLVLGQSDFERVTPGISLRRLHTPSALRFDARGTLYVVDTDNDRVLAFDPPFKTGMGAARTIGSRLYNPVSVEVDPRDRGLWVNDQQNGMIELWAWEGQEVLAVIGKPSYQPQEGGGPSFRNVPGYAQLWDATGIAFDAQDNMLVSIASYAQDVLRIPIGGDAASLSQDIQPDKRFFYPPGEYNHMGRKGFRSPRGVVVYEDQLVVADFARLLFWNGLDSLSNGKEADGVVGNEGWRPWPACCGRIKADSAGRLWSLSWEGRDFLDVYQLPLHEFSVPIATLWTGSAAYPVLGSEDKVQIGGRIFGLLPVDGGKALWLSDTDNHRVLRIRNPLTEPVVDVILGQLDVSETRCNREASLGTHQPIFESFLRTAPLDRLCFPGALSLDRFGNLYVSDHALEIAGNRRLLVYSAADLPLNNPEVLFAIPATKPFRVHGRPGNHLVVEDYEPRAVIDNRKRVPVLAATWEPAFDSTNRMVVGYNMYGGGRFVGVVEDPLGPGTQPDAYLHDLWSMAYSATFDEDDNLYMSDINRGRVLIYHNPFGNPASQIDREPVQPALLPEYPVTIESVSPGPPFCAVRSSPAPYERQLSLKFEGLPTGGNLQLQFRKMTSANAHRVLLPAGALFSMDMAQIGYSLWSDHERVKLTVRVVRRNGGPLSNWSPAFVLAEDVAACGVALPEPPPTPTPTPTPVPSPTATPTPRPTATPTHTPSPTPMPSLEPTPTPTSPAPTPTATVEPTPTPALTPTAAPPSSPLEREENGGPPVPLIAVIVAGAALLAIGGGVAYALRRRR